MPQKHILVVGGTSGIGAALVDKLRADGYAVLTAARHDADITWDATAGDFPTDALPDTLDGVAYLPGSIRLRPFHQLKPEAFKEDFDVNALGAVRVLQACRKPLLAADAASVVLVSTVAVQTGMAFHASVAAAKGAVEGLARSLAADNSEWLREG